MRAEGHPRSKNVALLVVAASIALVAADAAFRVYERLALRTTVRVSGDRVDLERFNYNDGEVTVRKPEAEFRVLSFGDSFAYAIVQYPYSYHAVAAEQMAPVLGRPVRIVNLGEPATSFEQYRQALAFWSQQLEHDAILVNVYLGNDVLDVAYGYAKPDLGLNQLFAEMPFAIRDGRPRPVAVPRRFPLRMLDWGWALVQQARQPRQAPIEPRYNRAVILFALDQHLANQAIQLDSFDPAKLERLRPGYVSFARLIGLVSEARRSGKHVLVSLAPNQTMVDAELRAAIAARLDVDFARVDLALVANVLRRVAHEIDPEIPILDLTVGLRCVQEHGTAVHYRTDSHWSVEGNAAAGQAIARAAFRHWFPDREPPPLSQCADALATEASPSVGAALSVDLARYAREVAHDPGAHPVAAVGATPDR